VDGSEATIWAPAPSPGSGNLTVDLGRRTQVTSILPSFTDTRPSSYRILTSADGRRWTEAPSADPDGTLAHPVQARYVLVEFTRPENQRAGIRELEVK
jgi:hypothetical protein